MNAFINISMKQKIVSVLFIISSMFNCVLPLSAQDDTKTDVHLPIVIAGEIASNKDSVDGASAPALEQATSLDLIALPSSKIPAEASAQQPYAPMIDGQIFEYTDLIILIDNKPATVAQLDEQLADHLLSAEKLLVFIDGMEIPVYQAKATISKGRVQIDGVAELLNKAGKQWGVGLTVALGEQHITLKWEAPKGGEGAVRYDGLADIGEYVIDGRNWGCRPITYFFRNGTDDIVDTDERTAVHDAFVLWQAATNLQFVEVPTASMADIEILWGAGDHGDPFPFDGPNGVLAHAFFPPPNGGALAGDTHFDEDETWTLSTRPDATQPMDLVTVAAHEIGHALGLGHSTVTGALMFPFYTGSHRFLHADDMAGIQQIYGGCPPPYWQHQDDNAGGGAVGWWKIGAKDKYAIGDFDADGSDDVFSANPNGWSHLHHYENGSGDFSNFYSNNGSGNLHWWHIGGADKYVAGDFDGDKRDELLAINPNGYAHLMQYSGGSWSSPWVNGGNGAIHLWSIGAPDRYLAGDFNADGKDELLAINPVNGWSHTIRFDANGWQWLAGNNGAGQMAYWLYGANDWYLPGNFTGGVQDRLLNINPNGWWHLLRYQ